MPGFHAAVRQSGHLAFTTSRHLQPIRDNHRVTVNSSSRGHGVCRVEAAAVGLGEAEARSKRLKFRLNSEKVSNWCTARRLNDPVYGFKTPVEEGTGRILGAHLVGPHAEEVINLLGLAIRHGLSAKDLKTTMFAYPTGATDIGYKV